MCELKVIIDQKLVFENAIYATTTVNSVVVKDIMGKSRVQESHNKTLIRSVIMA